MRNLPNFQHLEKKHTSLHKTLLPLNIFEHCCLHTAQEAFVFVFVQPLDFCAHSTSTICMLLKSTEPICKRLWFRWGERGEMEAHFPNGDSQRKSPSARVRSPFLAILIATVRWKPTWKRNTPLTLVCSWCPVVRLHSRNGGPPAQGNTLLTLSTKLHT